MRRNVSFSLTRLGMAAAVLGAVLAVSTPAAAQDDVTLTMARERFKEGVAYFDKKDFAKARVAFLQAYALKKHPAVLLNLAQSELRSGHEADAARHFSQYLREHKDASESERQGAETGLAAAKALVAEIWLDVDASGAEVYVDGESAGTTPLPSPIFLAPGSHRIQLRKEGKTTNSDIAVAAGQSTRLSLKLAAPAAPPPTKTTPLHPEDITPTPPDREPTVEQESPGRTPFVRWVGRTPGAIVGVGLTGVGLIGGGAFAFASKSAYDAADSVAAGIGEQALKDGKATDTGACLNLDQSDNWLARPPSKFAGDDQATRRQARALQYQQNCDKYQNNVDSGDTYKKVAIVSFAVAGAAAIGTIIYYFADSKESSSQAKDARRRRLLVLPVYQSGYSGALITGTF